MYVPAIQDKIQDYLRQLKFCSSFSCIQRSHYLMLLHSTKILALLIQLENMVLLPGKMIHISTPDRVPST